MCINARDQFKAQAISTVQENKSNFSNTENMAVTHPNSPACKKAQAGGVDSQLNNKRKNSPLSKDRSKNKKTNDNKNGKCDTKSTSSLTTKGYKRHFAEHNYHDYAQLRPSEVDFDKVKGSRGGVHNPFPVVLHKMMEEADEKDFSNIVSWQSHGRAFLIRDPKVFVAEILPKYFKHSKLSSFQRQLSLYGFVRLTQDGKDRGAYYHECFLRGRPFLCTKIQRTRVKGTWVRTSSSPESEPNFYTMEHVKDLSDIVDTSSQDGEQSLSSSGDDYSEQSLSEQDQGEDSSVGMSTPEKKTTVKKESEDIDIEKHIDDALALCMDDDEDESQHQSPTSLVQFFDFRKNVNHTSNFAGDRQIMHQPPADAALQPPPAFPNVVVSHKYEPTEISSTIPTITKNNDMTVLRPFAENNHFSSTLQFFAPKLPSFSNIPERWSLTSSLASGSGVPTMFPPPPPATEDIDLALFLTDVDLETDFDSDDVMQITAI